MQKKRECNIQDDVQIICPNCGEVSKVPMCKVVNGEEIFCQLCHKILKLSI